MFKHTHLYTPTLDEIVVEHSNAETTAIVVETSTMPLVCDACPGVALNLFMELLRVDTRTHEHINTYVYTDLYTCTYMHIHIHIHMRAYTYLHVYTCTRNNSKFRRQHKKYSICTRAHMKLKMQHTRTHTQIIHAFTSHHIRV